uniref:Uncharacterized protein n=1 Tax=Rhizophora mucronata TaxID=61149 RepID=A0A2P2PG57_RHIMU
MKTANFSCFQFMEIVETKLHN